MSSPWVDPIFNMMKVRFGIMDNLHVISKEVERVNVFINLEDPFKYLLTPRLDGQLKAAGFNGTSIQRSLMSNIVNLGQHYRLYCRKLNKDSRIFLYWNYPKANYANRAYWAKYREEHDRRMNRNINAELLTNAIRMMHPYLMGLIPFVRQIYIINGGELEASVVPYIITQFYNDGVPTQNLMISRDSYDYQYLGKGFTILDPRGLDSELVTEENVANKIKGRSTIKIPLSVPSGLIAFVDALLGDEYRCIPKLEGIGLAGAVKAINSAISNHLITETTRDCDILATILKDTIRSRFVRNYKMVNIDLQYKKMTPNQEDFIRTQIVDKFDDRTLQELNSTFFQTDPLMLIDTESERVIRDNPWMKPKN